MDGKALARGLIRGLFGKVSLGSDHFGENSKVGHSAREIHLRIKEEWKSIRGPHEALLLLIEGKGIGPYALLVVLEESLGRRDGFGGVPYLCKRVRGLE